MELPFPLSNFAIEKSNNIKLKVIKTMKTKQLLTTAFFAATLVQMPVSVYALEIKVNNLGTRDVARSPGKKNQPVIPVTYYDEITKTFSITSRVSIPEAVITVTKDGEEISNETMPINRSTVIEYDFSNDEAGEYVITIAVDGIVVNVDSIIC